MPLTLIAVGRKPSGEMRESSTIPGGPPYVKFVSYKIADLQEQEKQVRLSDLADDDDRNLASCDQDDLHSGRWVLGRKANGILHQGLIVFVPIAPPRFMDITIRNGCLH